MAVKRILRYLKGTINLGLFYSNISGGLAGFSDSDFASDKIDRRSCSGFVFTLSSGAIAWSSRRQSSVALSTAEAEYISLATASREAVWLGKVVTELLGESNKEPITMNVDNQSAIAVAKNSIVSCKTKHVDVKYHFVRDLVRNNIIKLQYCPTENMTADILTKPLDKVKFEKFRNMLGLISL